MTKKQKYLLELVVKKRLTAKVAAAMIGTTEQMFDKWSSGQHSPSLKFAIRISKVLGPKVDMEKLLTNKDMIFLRERL